MVQSKKHALGAILTISPLIRRVSIYLLLSTIAVVSINLIEISQEGAYKIYLPLFIIIYVLSRWIDSKFPNHKRRKNHRIKSQDQTKPKDSQQIRRPSYLESWLGIYQGTSVSNCCCICCCEAMLLSEDFSWDGGLFVVLSSASRCWSLASFISFKTRWRWSLASFKAAALSM